MGCHNGFFGAVFSSDEVRTLIDKFRRFKVQVPSVDDVPDEYELDNLVYQVAQGIPEQIDYVWNRWTYSQCIEVQMMKRYDNYVQDTVIKKSNG